MSDWKDLVDMAPEELAQVKHNDPRLDAFANAVEDRYGLPRGLVEAVKNAGERSNTGQASPKGAKGVMQFIDSTRKAYPHDVNDPLASIDAAGQYFKDLIGKYGHPMAAIAAYNGGTAAGKRYLANQPLPSAETTNYINRIRGYMESKYGDGRKP